MSLAFHHVTFAHEGALSPLLINLTLEFSAGWTGIVGANGSGKTTVLQLAEGALLPQLGTIRRPRKIVHCPQRTDHAPLLLSQFISATEAGACVLRGRLEIGLDCADRWNTLSHGERKRAQIAVALWQKPDLLLVDEPTNHIDVAARVLLAEALQSFRGIGLLVSHDRALLDLLCRQCLFLDPPQAVLRPGNHTDAAAQARREEASLLAERQKLQRQLLHLTEASQQRQAEAGRADRKNSKRGLARGDSDTRARIDLARVSGKDGQAGRLANQLNGRLARAQERVSSIEIKKHYAANFWLDGSSASRQLLFDVPAGTLHLSGSRRLVFPPLVMRRLDRIGITGANGLGKSRLIEHILDQLDLPAERVIYLPQEIDLERTREVMADVRRLSHEQLGFVMTVVSGLGSRPERLLQSIEPSPGELRKVMLALGVARRPYLIVMDEPTNHLDLPAVEALEDALSGCPCGLLLVSHDLRFLARIADRRWHFEQSGDLVTIETNGTFGGAGSSPDSIA